MRAIMVGAWMALAITAGAAQTRNKITAEDKALNDWASCTADAIVRLDDGKSDAASVARAVSVECRMKRDILLNLMSASDLLGDLAPTARRAWLEEMKAGDVDRETSMVLEYRAASRRHAR
jgi:hypothetical protein